MKKVVGCILIALLLLCPLGTAVGDQAFEGVFVDTQGHWAASAIDNVYNRGLMQGMGVDESGLKLFCPEEAVTRCQLAVVLDRTFDLDYGNMQFIKEPAASDYYYDVEDDAWYSEAITRGAINRIFNRMDEFKGTEKVTRIEIAMAIYQGFQVKGINVPMIMLMPHYDDMDGLSQDEINALIFVSNTNIMKGSNQLFRPYDPIKRSELARVLTQCAELIDMNPVEAPSIPDIKLESKEVKSESQLINIDLNIPVVSGMADKEAQNLINQLMEKDALDRQAAMIADAEANSDFIRTEPYHTYEFISRFYQYYATDDILSLYVDYYSFTGGAHGMTERKAYNFDFKTGEELELSYFFAPEGNYPEMINEIVQAEINRNPEIYFEGEGGFQGIKEDQGFYVENDNLIVFFLQYEIAPYAAGIRTFAVPLPGYNLQNTTDEAKVIRVVEDFGQSLKSVSLLAPADIVTKSIQENYGQYVSPDLLAKWQQDPENAPGRVTSSPWPERIDVLNMEKKTDFNYEIKGEIIKVTSVDLSQGGYASKQPITLTVEKEKDSWLITSYEYDEKTDYINPQYGFNFALPESWQGYTVITDQWQGTSLVSLATEDNPTGPLISIRHPLWTEANQRQDIPIMVFTLAQWNSLQQGEFSVGAAPIGPRELGRNNQYIFALPARYNFAFPTGYEEVEEILENKPLTTFAVAE